MVILQVVILQRLCLNINIFKKKIFGEIVFDNDFRKIKKIQDDVKYNDNFDDGNIYKISFTI